MPGITDLAPDWFILAQNGTHLGVFKNSFVNAQMNNNNNVLSYENLAVMRFNLLTCVNNM